MSQFDQLPNLESTGPKGPLSENWLVEAIIVTLMCCLPFGVVGIIKASEVNSKIAAGDHEGAARAKTEAAKWTKIGFFVGLGVIVLYVIFIAVVGFGTAFAR